MEIVSHQTLLVTLLPAVLTSRWVPPLRCTGVPRVLSRGIIRLEMPLASLDLTQVLCESIHWFQYVARA